MCQAGTALGTGALVENSQIRKSLWPYEVLVERQTIRTKQICTIKHITNETCNVNKSWEDYRYICFSNRFMNDLYLNCIYT